MITQRLLKGAALAAVMFACAGQAQAAETLYSGGDILTMAGDRPQYVEALAVKDGRIVFAGERAAARAALGEGATEVDLAGRTLLPGFIDGHGHLPDYVISWKAPDLSPPPVSDVASIADIQDKLRKFIADTSPPPGRLLTASGYDDGLLAEKRHPTRAELDAVSTELPIVIIHASGHLVVANSVALEMIGYGKDVPDPPGGVIRRDENGDPTGVLEEKAAYPILPLVQRPSPEEQLYRLGEIQSWYSSFGITTAQDGLSNPANLALLRQANRENRLIIDIVSYPMWTLLSKVVTGEEKLEGVEIYPPAVISNAGRELASDTPQAVPTSVDGSTRGTLKIGRYEGRHKIGGVKISADGSPQGKTAYMTRPYLNPPPGQGKDYRAYPVVEQAELDLWLDKAYQHNVQLIVHTNGDAAIDSIIAAVAKARAKHGPKDLRPVAIHSQLARHDQVDRMKELGIVPSFFSAHTYFWGDWHINETFGKERAYGISPLNYASGKGIKFSNHTDSPVVPPDMMMLVWTAVNRMSRSGEVVGPAERVSPYIALKALTDWAAYQYFEDADKGTLEPGKRADLVILSENPLKADPLKIKDIDVIETIKDGVSIYRADALGTKWAPKRPRIPFLLPRM